MDSRTFWAMYFAALAVGALIGLALASVAKGDVVLHNAIRNNVVKTATKYRIDPILVLAIITVESRGNPKAVGTKGEIGLMQLRPEFHPGVTFDVKTNIRMGIHYLSYVKKHCPNNIDLEYVTCYNKGTARKLKYPTKAPYYIKVMREYTKLLAQNGEVTFAGSGY